MAVFTFDKVDEYVQDNDNKINFLKLQDDGWIAKVRFMYGPGQTFTGMSVHNVSSDPKRAKNVPCLREPGQSVDVCPLCKAGNKIGVQYYMPVYVISITGKVNGVVQEQPVNDVYIFQRGKNFSANIGSIVRQCNGTPIVSNIFNIVRSGKAGDQGTTYITEFVGRDETTIESLPPVPQVLGSYILPNLTAQQMIEKYLNNTQEITPRTIQTNTQGTVVQPQQQMINGMPANPPKFSF